MSVLAILIIALILSAPASRAQDTNQLAITYFDRAFEKNRMREYQAAILDYSEAIRLKQTTKKPTPVEATLTKAWQRAAAIFDNAYDNTARPSATISKRSG